MYLTRASGKVQAVMHEEQRTGSGKQRYPFQISRRLPTFFETSTTHTYPTITPTHSVTPGRQDKDRGRIPKHSFAGSMDSTPHANLTPCSAHCSTWTDSGDSANKYLDHHYTFGGSSVRGECAQVNRSESQSRTTSLFFKLLFPLLAVPFSSLTQ